MRKTKKAMEKKIKYIKNYIIRGLKKGKSANQMLKELKNKGKGIQRKRFLELVREIKGIKKKSDAYTNIKRDAKIPEKFYEPSSSFTKDRYYTIFKVKIIGLDEQYRNIGYYHSKLMTRKEIEQQIIKNLRAKLEANQEMYNFNPMILYEFKYKIKLVQGFKRVEI